MTWPSRTLQQIKDKAGCSRMDLQDLHESLTLTRQEARELRSRQRKATAAARAKKRKWYEDL